MTAARSRFRTLLGHFATGVSVVTAVEDGVTYGMTVNAFCSVSLDPCLVLVSLRQSSATCDAIRRTGRYAVNILTAEQSRLAERFARHELDPAQRFAGIPFETRLTGAPILADALAHLECQVVAEHAGGDHMLLIGEVMGLEYPAEADEASASPLIFYRSAYATLPQERLLPLVAPASVPVASVAGRSRTRGLERLWDALWQWARLRGAFASLAARGAAPTDASIIEVFSPRPSCMSAGGPGTARCEGVCRGREAYEANTRDAYAEAGRTGGGVVGARGVLRYLARILIGQKDS